MPSQDRAPYFEALSAYARSHTTSFHVPGHQFGQGADPDFLKFLEAAPLIGDITQIPGMDDMHRPVSVCGQAQRLAAELWGAEQTTFLVNGSTVGNQAMLLATLNRGDKVLIPRNAHRSVLGGVLLADARPVFYYPPWDPDLGVFHAPRIADLKPHLEQHAELSTVVLSSPTYYGTASDMDTLVDFLRAANKIVLVDEAWGAHFGFHPELPRSAVQAGADLVVQSTHKMLGSMTQTAMLHRNGKRIDPNRLDLALRILQSTSPSPLFLASLDCARRQIATQGRELLARALQLAQHIRKELAKLPGVSCPGEELLSRPGVERWDPTRLLLKLEGFDGYQLEQGLRYRFGIQVEMAEGRHVLLVITLGHRDIDMEQLIDAVAQMTKESPTPLRPKESIASSNLAWCPKFSHSARTLREIFEAPQESVPLERAVGLVCAETLTTYPPGIPLVVPGEIITPDIVERIRQEKLAGGTLEGGADPSYQTVRVLQG